MTATYFSSGRGRSLRAIYAEDAGKLPLTRAIPVLAKALGVTRQQARAILIEEGPDEWHHTGKYAQMTDYYDLEGIIERIEEAAEEAEAHQEDRYLATYRDLCATRDELNTQMTDDYDDDLAEKWGMHWLDASRLYDDICDHRHLPWDARTDWMNVDVGDLSPIESLLESEKPALTNNWKREGF